MNYTDREKLDRLAHTFDLNYRVTGLYANYLENYPELIRPEMIDVLCNGSDISHREAAIAILTEAFGLDDAMGGDDRALIRNYIRPSVRMLDRKKYENNPYYKNIKIENVKDGAWEFKWEKYPAYRGVISDDMIINPDFSEIPPLGFFEEDFNFPAVLEDGNEWMTLTPVDLDTSDFAIERARGKVITFGLGLGYFAYMASEKEEVTNVTVIERSENVIRLFEKYILPQFRNKDKVRVICADAFKYAEFDMPQEEYDFAFVDTWRDASDGAPMYKRMKPLEAKNPKTEFTYWVENFLVSRLRALKFEELYEKVRQDTDDAPETYQDFIKELKIYGRDI